MINKVNEPALFSRLGANQEFITWLKQQHEESMKYLLDGCEPMVLYRAQGKAAFIQKLLKAVADTEHLRPIT